MSELDLRTASYHTITPALSHPDLIPIIFQGEKRKKKKEKLSVSAQGDISESVRKQKR